MDQPIGQPLYPLYQVYPLYQGMVQWRGWGGKLLAAVCLGLLWTLQLHSPVAAAEFATANEVYILPQDEVIADDLYVTAREIVINGTVEGDLLAAGAYVEINGAVNGSVMAAAAGVRINGVVQNSVRAAAMSVVLDGTVRKDFLATGGFAGAGFVEFPIPIANRTLTPGVELRPNSAVAGDVFLSGGSGRVAGVIGGDLGATLNQLDLGGHTEGNAEIRAETLQVQETARIGGVLTYASRSEVVVSDATAADVTVRPWPESEARAAPTPVNPLWGVLGWLWRTAIQLIGLGLIAWLLWTFAPHWVRRPADVIEARPVEAGLYGFVAVVVLLPLAAALIFLGVLFWGWFPGGLTFSAASFGLLSIAWLLSPVISGLWIGRRIMQAAPAGADGVARADFQALLLGILAIVLVANVVGVVPCLGLIAERVVYLLSLALALGGIVLTRLRPVPEQPVAAV